MGKRKNNKAKEVLQDFVLEGIKAAAEKEIIRIAEEVCNEELQEVPLVLQNHNAGKENTINAEIVSNKNVQESKKDHIAVQKPLGNNAENQVKKQGIWRIGYNERANLFGLKNQITKLLMHARKGEIIINQDQIQNTTI